MKLRLELLHNNGMKLFAVEAPVRFYRSIGQTLLFFHTVSRQLTVEVVHWLANNQDDLIKMLEKKNV